MSDTPQPAGVTLLGGEMLQWSDAGPAAGLALRELVGRVLPVGGRVLVAGPHATPIIDMLAARAARITCVLRSMPDARELARRNADRLDVTVCCGGLEKLPADSYDLIVALDGLNRLLSVDSPALPWDAVLRRLTGMLEPAGTLVLAAENELGIHRLGDRHSASPRARRDDEEWRPILGVDGALPTGPAALAGALKENGLTVDGCYAAFAAPPTPSLLVRCDLLETGELPGPALATLLSGVCGGDPRWMVRAALRGGLLPRLAPSWIVVARPAGADGSLPGLLFGDATTVCELSPTPDGGLARRLCGGTTQLLGTVVREPARLSAPLPVGETLEELLRVACERQDLPRLRRLLREYATWLHKQAQDGLLDGAFAFATADNVVVDASGFALADPSWQWARPLPADLVLGRCLRRFALRVLASGQHHPWPSAFGVDRICVTLHTMSGYPAGRDVLDGALLLEAEILAAQEGRPVAEAIRSVQNVLTPPGAVSGHRELVATLARLQDQVQALQDQVAWTDKTLAGKEERLKEARLKLDQVRDDKRELRDRLREARGELRQVRRSASFRMGRLLTAVPRLLLKK